MNSEKEMLEQMKKDLDKLNDMLKKREGKNYYSKEKAKVICKIIAPFVGFTGTISSLYFLIFGVPFMKYNIKAYLNKETTTYDDNTKYKVTSIKGYAYDDLAFDYIDADIVILPSTLTSIEHQTFYEGKFNYITIPSSVTTIGPGALSLTHNLRMIYNKTGKSFDWCDVFQYYPCSIDTSDGGITGVVTLGNSSEDTKSIIITN